MTCSNCGSTITCGCQVRTAKDGKKCCSHCVTAYNNSLPDSKKDDQVLTLQQQLIITMSNK